MGWACRSCHGENPHGTRFCGHCGTPNTEAEREAPDVGDVIERLSRGQVPEAASSEQQRGQRRLVTAMFADISGFTALADTRDPETVTDIVTVIVSELSKVVGRYDGYVDKYAGDALLAFFGAPVSHEDDAERALACALEMQDRFEAIQPTLGAAAHPLGLHIGINSGHAIALVIGSEVRADYSVLGDAINVAQRLESQAPAGEVYVGALTERLARRSFALEPIGELDLKGKAEPVPAWRLAGRREIAADDGVVIGRAPERAALRAAFDRLVTLVGSVTIVSGYAGVGKTSLIDAARADAAARGLRWIDLRAVSYRSGSPYEPVINLLTTLAGEGPHSEVPARLELLLADLGIGERAAALVALLAPTWPDRDDVDPQARRARLRDAFTTLLDALARRDPLVLAAEDIHWADDATVELLAYVAARAERLPLLLIASSRTDSEVVDRIRNEAIDATRLVLDGLSDMEMLALVRQVGGAMPDATEASICARARGNPFFAVEMVRGVARGENVGTSDDLPPTIESALASRLDRLTPDGRLMIDVAATIGATVPVTLLRATAPDAGVRDVNVAIKELVENELLEPARAEPDTLEFRHALVQEVASSRMLRRHARALHLRIADEIERTSGTDSDAGDVLADHLYRAEAGARAVDQLLRSARRAEDVYANDTAILHLRRARELVLRDDAPAPNATELTLRLAELHRQVGAYAEAGDLYRSLLDGPAAVRAACGLAASLRTHGNYRGALDVLDTALRDHPAGACLDRPRARTLPDGGRQLPGSDRVVHRRSRRRRARRPDSRDLAERPRSRRVVGRPARSGTRARARGPAFLRGIERPPAPVERAARARWRVRRPRAPRRGRGGPPRRPRARPNGSVTSRKRPAASSTSRSSTSRAARSTRRSRATGGRLPNSRASAIPRWRPRTRTSLRRCSRGGADDIANVREHCDSAIAIAMKHGDMLTVADAGLTAAIADQRSGRTAQARESAELAAARFVEVGALDWAAKAFTIAAECCDADGNHGRATELRQRAAEVSGTSGRPPRRGTASPT